MIIDVADGDREIAVGEHAILIGDVVPAVVFDRLEHAAHEARPVASDAPQWQRTVLAMQRSIEILIAFELAKERQHAVPVPAGSAAARPFVIVAGQAAHGHHAVYRRSAADDAALRVAPARPLVGRVAGPWPERRRQAGPGESRI